MPKFRVYFFIFITVLFLSNSLFSQQNYKKRSTRYYHKNPVWITMMNDPKTNYNETIKAFRAYWKNRILPKEEFEIAGSDSFEKEMGLEENEKEEKENHKKNYVETGISYATEVRAFKGWVQSNKLWVRADGSIIPEQERQQLINQQQLELKEIEKKNGKK